MAENEQISRMRDDFVTFLRASKSLTEEQALHAEVCGEWSAKQIVDHLTGWQVESINIIDRLLNVEEEELDLDIDGFNASSVRDREARDWTQSLTELEESFNTFDHILRGTGQEAYEMHSGLASWVRAMTQEYRFHLAHIEKARKVYPQN